MAFDLYVWNGPRDVDATTAGELVARWELGGADAAEPFEPSVDLGWFLRELAKDEPNLEVASDVPVSPTRIPIWLAPDDPPPTRVVAIRLPLDRAREVADDVFSLAMKYDLVVYDPVHARVDHPLEAMAAYASATFWPRGAIRAAVVGGIGLVAAIAAWIVGIPIASGVVVVVGAFLFVMAVVTFLREGRVALRRR